MSGESQRQPRCPARVSPCAVTVFCLLLWHPATAAAQANDQPKLVVAASPLSTPSKISATIEFSIPALDRALEGRVPRRLATFNDRAARCWHRQIFRREVDIDCVYSGFVERTARISLRAEDGRLAAAVPVYGFVSGQGLGRFTRFLHGTADGQLTVYAAARPRLRPDWTVDLDIGEGYRWEQPPILRILGFAIDLSRFVEPRIREQLERVRADASAYLRDLDLRGKAETAWRAAATPVKIYDSPEIWLRMTPQTVAFAGTHARGDVLEGSLEMTGTVETSVGAAPPDNPPPLPALGSDVAEPGRFEVVVPVGIDFDVLRAKIEAALTATPGSGAVLRDVQIHRSGDKIVFGLRLAPAKAGSGDGDWIYLSATPTLDAEGHAIEFPDFSLSGDTPAAAAAISEWFRNDTNIQSLRQQLRLDYQSELEKIVASANARLTRSMGNGFRSEAHLASSGVPTIELLPDGIRADFRVTGDLKILYGL